MVFGSVRCDILDSLNFLGLLQFLVVQLQLTHLDLVTLEIFYSEPDPTDFDSVKFLNLVIVLSSFIFEGAGNEPKLVNTLLLLVGGGGSVVKIVAFGIFLQKAETASIRTLLIVDLVIRLVKIYLIVIPDDLTLGLGFQAHLDDVTGLVIE